MFKVQVVKCHDEAMIAVGKVHAQHILLTKGVVLYQGSPTWGTCTPRDTFAYTREYLQASNRRKNTFT